MPIIKSAKKKLRQQKKKTEVNKKYKHAYKDALNAVAHSSSKKKDGAVKSAYKKIDKAAKKGIIHRNKASRLKSRVAKRKS